MSPNVLYPFSYACVIKSSQSVSPFSLLPYIQHSFLHAQSYLKDSQTQTKNKPQKVKRILVRAQTVMSMSPEGYNQGTGTLRTSGWGSEFNRGWKTNSKPRAKQTQHGGEYKAPETFDKCLLKGSLKMDLCQLVRPKVNYLWPATYFSHNSLCTAEAVIHIFVNREQSGLKCAWSSPQVCAAFQDGRG